MSGRVHRISSSDELERVLAHRHPSLRGKVIEDVAVQWLPDWLDVAGAVFLGCEMDAALAARLRDGGALLFPEIPQIPFDPYQPQLYSPDELYDTDAYEHTFDARIYAWTRRARASRQLVSTLGTALHDHAIEAALDAALAGTGSSVVGIMGGHALLRTDAGYAEAARLARALTRGGRTVLTGGGPGAMEAANLGAFLADAPDHVLDDALTVLAEAPSFRPSIDAWVRTARQVRELVPDGAVSLGIPTWFYGHEPPNMFATGIAKFFANPIREATLLARCTGGIVYLPGAAGTVQEIFADACENYYAAADAVAPMVLVGSGWADELPAWQLLQRLASGTAMAEQIFTVADAEAALAPLGVSVER